MPQLEAVWMFLFTIIDLRVVCLEFHSLWCWKKPKKLLPVWSNVTEMDRHKLRVTALGNKPGMNIQRSLSEMLHCWTMLDHVIETQRLNGSSKFSFGFRTIIYWRDWEAFSLGLVLDWHDNKSRESSVSDTQSDTDPQSYSFLHF